MKISRAFSVGILLFLGVVFVFGGVASGNAGNVQGQSPVLIVAPNYANAYTTAGGHQSLPGSPVYLTPDGYPVMRTAQGQWIYMVNPEAVRIPGPQITVINPGVPLIYGYPYPCGMAVPPQVQPVPQHQEVRPASPQGMVVPPVGPSSGQMYYYPTGAGGFIVQPQ